MSQYNDENDDDGDVLEYDDERVDVCVTYYNERMECGQCHKTVYKCSDCYNPICFSESCKTRYIRSWRVRLDPCCGHDFCQYCKKVVVCSTKACKGCNGKISLSSYECSR
jgi:hypothetical protein